MHITASGFTAISYDVPAKAFFVCWYIFGVLFLLNLLTASLLSSFLSFWIRQKTIVLEAQSHENDELSNQHDDNDSSTIENEHQDDKSYCSNANDHVEQHSNHEQQHSHHDFHEAQLKIRGRANTAIVDDLFDWFRLGEQGNVTNSTAGINLFYLSTNSFNHVVLNLSFLIFNGC